MSLFQLDLQAASSLLHAAIRKLDVKKTDSAQVRLWYYKDIYKQ